MLEPRAGYRSDEGEVICTEGHIAMSRDHVITALDVQVGVL